MSPARTRLAATVVLLAASSVRAETDPWFARDKCQHFVVSTVLAGAAYAVAGSFDADPSSRLWAGGGVALGVGTAKELWDLTGRGDSSWKDLTWDGLGTATGLATAWWVDRWWRRRHPARG
jgi:putative lipoprotein